MPISRVRCETEYETAPHIPTSPKTKAMLRAIVSSSNVKDVRPSERLKNGCNVSKFASGRFESTLQIAFRISFCRAIDSARGVRITNEM
jgi:hypothetical protein